VIVAILQARLSSSRLPGKVMLPVQGEPMLIRQVERIARAKRIGRIIVATSATRSDDSLAELCRARNIELFRGDLDDVLDRFYHAASPLGPEYVVRLTGDCPLADPAIIDAVIDFCIAGNFDYASNALEPTFPDGLDVEVMKFHCLRDAWVNARLPSHREHVTPYIYQHRDKFRVGSFKQAIDLSALRWTVDETQDYQLICRIYDALYPDNPAFTSDDVMHFLRGHPELNTLNRKFQRNEGYQKSLDQDEALIRDIKR